MTENERAGRSALNAVGDGEGLTIGAWIAELKQQIAKSDARVAELEGLLREAQRLEQEVRDGHQETIRRQLRDMGDLQARLSIVRERAEAAEKRIAQMVLSHTDALAVAEKCAADLESQLAESRFAVENLQQKRDAQKTEWQRINAELEQVRTALAALANPSGDERE